MYPVLKIMHMLNFLDTFSVGVTLFVEAKIFLIVLMITNLVE